MKYAAAYLLVRNAKETAKSGDPLQREERERDAMDGCRWV
jgi:hypothetical protein